MNFTQTFAAAHLPEFITSDYPKFKLFLDAYFEYLEKQNTATASTAKELYKELPNAAALINLAGENRDIDETLDSFVDYFKSQVVGIDFSNASVSDRYFVKKVRDVYLAKGSPKSFKLFFRMLLDEEIEMIETGAQMLRASDSKYLQFTVAHFLVTDYEEQIGNIEYNLSAFKSDSDTYIQTILQAAVVDEYQDQKILRVQFAGDVDVNTSKIYYIADAANENINIQVTPIYTYNGVTINDRGSLYSANDSITISSTELDKQYNLSITETTSGKVDYVSVRDRGSFYNIGDTFQFTGDTGAGGSVAITDIENGGKILGLNNYEVRTGSFRQGYLSEAFLQSYIPIISGGSWRQLPNVAFTANTTTTNSALPYNATRSPYGAQVVATSTSIGKINNLSINEYGYFINDSDYEVVIPSVVVIDNPEGLVKGNVVSFQMFEPSGTAFTDDSDQLVYSISAAKDTYSNDADTAFFSIKLPYDYNELTSQWVTSTWLIDKNFNFESAIVSLKSVSGFDVDVSYSLDSDQFIIDGGNDYDGVDWINEADGPDSFGGSVSETIDGGDGFEFVGRVGFTATIQYSGDKLSGLTSTQFNQLDNFDFADSEVVISHSVITGEFRTTNSEEVGVWKDTGYYGKINSFNTTNNVLTITKDPSRTFLTKTNWETLQNTKYNVVRLQKVEADGTADQDHFLPITNAVVFYNQADVTINLAGSAKVDKDFFNETGFLSSSYGGVLRDNYFYSEHTYNIKTKTPVASWRSKVKTLLHPAGKIMIGELSAEQYQMAGIDPTATTTISKDYSTPIFDASQDFYTTPSAEIAVTADNTYYKANAFEFFSNTASGAGLTADHYQNLQNISTSAQNGNAWWDYEPVGFVSDYSTQDSDGTGHVANDTTYYRPFDNTAQDFYKRQRRGDKKAVVRTLFSDTTNQKYQTYSIDTSLSYASFGDSDASFESIDYTNLRNAGLVLPASNTDRQLEIAKLQEADLLSAMKEDGSLTFVEGTTTYTDFDAFERKWNYIGSNRTIGTDGWLITGYSAQYQNINNDPRGRKGKYLNNTVVPKFSTTKTPLNEAVWRSSDYWVWNEGYDPKINTTKSVNINKVDTTEVYDPRERMKGRK